MTSLGLEFSIWQVVVWAGMGISVWFSLTSIYGAWDFFTRRRPEDEPSEDWMPPVTILKPLKGLDPELYENLSTFCRQEYPEFQLVFGVADPDDPAVGVVRKLQREHPALDISLVIDGRMHGTNDKVSNLINMYREAKHDVLVLSDSDIRVPDGYLCRVVAPLRDRRIGLVTCLYRAVAAKHDLPTILWCLTINTTLTPQILVARQVEKPTYAFGATLALRRSTLEAAGGFLHLANMLADDYCLGNRIASQGFTLWLSDCVVTTVLEVGSWTGLLHHQVRRARTNRSVRPLSHFGTILTNGVLWATLHVIASGASVSTLLAALVNVGARLAAIRRVSGHYLGVRLSRSERLLALVMDLWLSVVWLLGFSGSSIWWKGRRFRILKSGEMQALPLTPSAPSISR